MESKDQTTFPGGLCMYWEDGLLELDFQKTVKQKVIQENEGQHRGETTLNWYETKRVLSAEKILCMSCLLNAWSMVINIKLLFPKYFPKSSVKYILFNDAFEENQFLGKNVGKR